jgi:hypothetical protein
MGTVMVTERPALPVSPSAYRTLLRERLEAKMAEADQGDLKDVLARLETQENLRLLGTPNPAEIIVEGSPSLRELAAYPTSPIPPQAWIADRETAEAIEQESAVGYLESLVR